MLSLVVKRCTQLLGEPPDAVLPPQRVGPTRPARAQDIPVVVVGVAVEEPRVGAIGRALRFDDEVREVRPGDVYSGVLTLEAWAASAAEVEGITLAIERRVQLPSTAARAHGFLRMYPASLEPAESVLIDASVGTAAGWRQRLTYRFTCEVEDARFESEGGPIERIDITGSGPAESFAVTRASGEQ